MRRTPPVGSMVQFFAGDSKKGTDPIAAIVTKSGANGTVKLTLFYPGGGDVRTSGEFIHHIDDPWVREHPQQVTGVRFGVARGVWDWVPSGELLDDTSEEDGTRRKEGEKRVALLLREGASIHDAARQVRTYGLSKKDVEKIAEAESVKV